MLTKIVFTLVVIIGVALFYRNKQSGTQPTRTKPKPDPPQGPPSTRALAYIMLGILVAISCAVFAYHWHRDNRIVNIRVTAEGSEVVHYQARHKDIKGRKFISLDGIQVTLGQGDRIEILHQ